MILAIGEKRGQRKPKQSRWFRLGDSITRIASGVGVHGEVNFAEMDAIGRAWRSCRLWWQGAKGDTSRGGTLEPTPPEATCKGAQAGNEPSGDAEFGSEVGDSFNPGRWIGPDPKQDGCEIGIDGSAFIGPRHPSCPVDEIEILRCSHGQNAEASGIGLNGTQPVIFGMCRNGDRIGSWGGNCGRRHCFLLPGTDSFLDAGKVAFFRSFCQAGPDGIEVYIHHAGCYGRHVEEGLAFEPRFPEAAFDVIFFVCGSGNEFVQAAHEPAEAAEALAELSDALRIIGQGVDVFVGWGDRGALCITMPGEENQPAGCNFPIGPQGNDVGTGAQNGVVVGLQDGVCTDLDGENGGEKSQPVDDPCFAMGEISERKLVESAEERPPDTPTIAVIHSFFSILHVSAAWQSHDPPLCHY